MKPNVLILHATGTNRDLDVAQAFDLAGANPHIYHLNQLRMEKIEWNQFQILVIPGGFSYADALGAGKLFGFDLNKYFRDEVNQFVSDAKPVIGICNGFQALLKSGVLLPPDPETNQPSATLGFNDCGNFECRWVTLKPVSRKCIWTNELEDLIDCPVAHGEGKFTPFSPLIQQSLYDNDQIALVYTNPEGKKAEGKFPENPNGSILDIAGICNHEGNVLGLMPHPENHIFSYQHPGWTLRKQNHLGLNLFKNGVKYSQSN